MVHCPLVPNAALIGLAVSVFLMHGTRLNAETTDIMRIEETWSMVVTTADATSGAPQLNTVMSPYPHVDSYYGLLTLNYRDLPEVTLGGLQAQIWYDTANLDYSISNTYQAVAYDDDDYKVLYYVDDARTLGTAGETVTWTQTLILSEGTLSFDVQGARSVTWGDNFVRQASTAAAQLVSLNGYTPDISAAYTRRWGLERDRISSLKITRIRKWNGLGDLVSDENTDITVLPY